MNMKEQLRAVAKEYARQFGKIIGIEPDYWVGGDISLEACAFADYFFDLNDNFLPFSQNVFDIDATIAAFASFLEVFAGDFFKR